MFGCDLFICFDYVGGLAFVLDYRALIGLSLFVFWLDVGYFRLLYYDILRFFLLSVFHYYFGLF